jgi:hypothetical protein
LKHNPANAHHPLPHAVRVGTKATPLGTDNSAKACGIEDLVGRAVLKDIAARMVDRGLAPHHQDAAARRRSIADVASTADSRGAGVDPTHKASVRHVRAVRVTADPAVKIESTVQVNAGMKGVTASKTAVVPRATNSLTDRRVVKNSETHEAPGAVKMDSETVAARTGDFGQTSARNLAVSTAMATGCCRVRNFSSFGHRLPAVNAQVPGVNALLLSDNMAPLKYRC